MGEKAEMYTEGSPGTKVEGSGLRNRRRGCLLRDGEQEWR